MTSLWLSLEIPTLPHTVHSIFIPQRDRVVMTMLCAGCQNKNELLLIPKDTGGQYTEMHTHLLVVCHPSHICIRGFSWTRIKQFMLWELLQRYSSSTVQIQVCDFCQIHAAVVLCEVCTHRRAAVGNLSFVNKSQSGAHYLIAMECITGFPLIIIIMGLEKNVVFLIYSLQGNSLLRIHKVLKIHLKFN